MGRRWKQKNVVVVVSKEETAEENDGDNGGEEEEGQCLLFLCVVRKRLMLPKWNSPLHVTKEDDGERAKRPLLQ